MSAFDRAVGWRSTDANFSTTRYSRLEASSLSICLRKSYRSKMSRAFSD
jgi:hypothetical protein